MSKEAKEVAKAVVTLLDERLGISESEHRDHHNYIRSVLKKMEQDRVFWAGVRKQVVGWGIIALLSGIGVAVADYFEWIFKGHH